MNQKTLKKIGLILICLGAAVIFTSAYLNASVGPITDMEKDYLKNIYVYDVISSIGIFLVPCGVVLFFGRTKIF